MSSGVCTLTRSLYEKTPFYYRSVTPFTSCLETNAVAAAVLDMYSTAVLMLSVRVKLLVKPVSDVLQILGILAEIEEKGILHLLDEPVWRSILLSCAWTGGSFMRQVAWTIFEIMQTLHVPFGAATYGAFVRAAVASDLSKFESFAGNQIDPFMYLEEMGLAWVLQRYAISESARKAGYSASKSLSPVTNQTSPAKWSYFPSSSWFKRSEQPGTASVDTQVSVLVNAATYTAAYLNLDRQYTGVINCYQPRHFLWLVTPIHVSIYSHPQPGLSPISASHSPHSPIPGSASGSLVPGAREALVRDLSKRLEKLHGETEATIYSASIPARAHSTADSKRAPSSSQSKSALPAPASTGSLASADTVADSSGSRSPAKELELSVVQKRWTSAKAEFSDEEGDCSETSGDAIPVDEDSGEESADEVEALTIDGIAISSKNLPKQRSSRRIKATVDPPASPAKAVVPNPDSKSSSPTRALFLQQQQQQSFRSELDEMKEPVSKLRLDHVTDVETKANGSVSSSPTRSTSRKLLPFDSLDSGAGLSPPPRSPLSRPPVPPGNGLSPTRRLSSTLSSNWVSNLENRVLQALHQDISCVVGMHSRTPCRCGYSLLDDEILAHSMFNFSAWPFSKEGKKTHLPSWSQPSSAPTCPQCHSSYCPKLHVRIYGKSDSAISSSVSASESLVDHWSLSVKYLSPKDVRLGVEEIVERVGEPVIEPKYMQTYRPDLYWNLVWYGCRVGLPLGFLAHDASVASIELFEPGSWSPRPTPSRTNLLLLDSLKCPVVVGWREDVVRVKVRNLFAGRLANDLKLSDVFPHSESEERVAHLQFIAELLDGSPSNMKKAIFLYRRYAGLLRHLFRKQMKFDGPRRSHSAKELSPRAPAVAEGSDVEKTASKAEVTTDTAAREMFVGLLFLAYFYKKASVAPRINTPTNTTIGSNTSTNTTAGLPAVETIPFCKAYLETVRHGLTTLDFQKLRLLKKEMVDSVSSEAVQAARLGFGLLF